MEIMERKGEIVIYKTTEGEANLNVTLQDETLWLNLNQISQLFDRDKSVISRHIKNVFKEGELIESSTIAFFTIVQKEGKREISRKIEFFNLDMIISVGYRVNSKKGTHFRIWATQTLKNHLIKGYTIDKKRRQEEQNEGEQTPGEPVPVHQSCHEIMNGTMDIMPRYTRSFSLLNQYDNDSLELEDLPKKKPQEINYHDAVEAMQLLKKELMPQGDPTDLFCQQKDDTFKVILVNIIQTFTGSFLYPSIEEQAAHLLYFIIKNRPFVDGNKRIGAFLFIWLLQRNNYLFRKNGEAKVNDNTLVTLSLLIAQSDPANKDSMIKLIINLINE